MPSLEPIYLLPQYFLNFTENITFLKEKLTLLVKTKICERLISHYLSYNYMILYQKATKVQTLTVIE